MPCACACARGINAEDKTIVEEETTANRFEVKTLYRMIRGIESRGFSDISMSFATLKRPETRRPGEPDAITVEVTAPHDFVLQAQQERDAYTAKTIFGAKLTRHTFPSARLVLAQRFRWVEMGKCLKPTKQYVVTSKRIDLAKGKPKMV